MQIAIIGELVKRGLSPKFASLSAISFADIGDEERSPGEHFESGQTFLLIGADTTPAVVANLKPGMGLDPFSISCRQGHRKAVSIVDLEEVNFEVSARLGISRDAPENAQ